MRRGTTPTLKLKLTGCDIDNLDDVYVTLQQEADHCCNQIQITKTEFVRDEDNNTFEVSLTQEETLKLRQGNVQVQIRATTVDGKAVATNIASVPSYRILMEGEI